MNLESLTIGQRIAVGFTALLLILGLLAAISLTLTRSAKEESELVAKYIVPVSDQATNVVAAMDEYRLNARVYGETGSQRYLELCRKSYGVFQNDLRSLIEILQKHEILKDLLKIGEELQKADSDYLTIFEETVTNRMEIQRLSEAIESGLSECNNKLMTLFRGMANTSKQELEAGNTAHAAQRLERMVGVNEALSDLTDFSKSAIHAFNGQNLENFRKEVSDIQTRIANLEDIRSQQVNPQNRELMGQVIQAFRNVEKDAKSLIQAWEKMGQINQRRAAKGEEVVKLTMEVVDKSGELSEAQAEKANNELKAAIQVIWYGAIVAIAIGIGCAFYITRSTNRVLTEMADSLGQGAEQVASASEQISSSSQSLAEGASEQAASLEETSASLEEISSMTKRNAENALSAKELASETRAAAEAGTANMEQMNRAMADIQAASDNISKIIKTIDEIAFQTNILALNAAVEAARAGEAGMGFAVVADEVRALAQRSAQAAKETAERIEDSIRKSAAGVELSAKVAESLQQIVTKARQMDELVAEIATASKEQSQGIEQVNSAVTQMDKVTQQNAAAAEESASASEELSAQAFTLREIVQQLQQLVMGRAKDGSTLRSSSLAKGGGAISELNVMSQASRTSSQNHPAGLQKRLEGKSRQRLGTATATRGEQPKLAAAKSEPPKKKKNPEEEIPMDEGFKDF